ncbi:MAG: hypothetical protein COU11_04385 [Candidatus Harrisonbacteria bacterium CG10_big_fil_rev_8_21_14_0_10_49_15]|uniref:DUF192 domain-containing protein n=1 Tax=Candidatus Harrisonbacteria bacterium CG10_big_fil_rev_8_21_14_0_10_49_15 TaxID=1974587 RepID=A0A2H0UJZ4_9BACT|nr:MAG: hypothetical protein COU11_04385 [Candidatus Harrisonbacteria bacterium CG10_big_fil_rev_8_21_14_0_10_49_15]
MDKKILLVLGLVVVFAIIAIITKSAIKKPITNPEQARVQIGEYTYMVDIADTGSEHAQGLSGRESLPTNGGMLFVFPTQRLQSFWMRGMNFPLDIIWINDEKVIGFAQDVPVPEGGQLPLYRSPEPADMVLELAAGTVAADGIKVGDSVEVEYTSTNQ